jgi:hypothetical protein
MERKMAEAKTQATDASVADYIASRASEEQRADCALLMAVLGEVTDEQPRMWGPSIVGYGRYRYQYDSGRVGESCMTGFAIRGRELVVYLIAEGEVQAALLQKLGKHKMGKSCLYFKRMADIDRDVLAKLVAGSISELKRRYPVGAA